MATSATSARSERIPRRSAPDRRESAAGGWMRGMRFSAFTLIMMGLAVLAVVVLAPTVQSWLVQRQQIATLEAQKSELQNTIDELSAERERWSDKTFITTQARERLSYVLPGEVTFLVINDLPALQGQDEPAPISDQLQSTRSDWMRSLFVSTMTAGLAPTAPAATEGSQQ